jgi:FdhD protein
LKTSEKILASQEHLTMEMSCEYYRNGVSQRRVIYVAREAPYTLFLNDREILSIATLPTHLEELFVGFLVSEGVLLSKSELLEIVVDHENRLARVELNVSDERIDKLEGRGMLTSGCAGGLIFSVESALDELPSKKSGLSISPLTILERMKDLDTFDGLYSLTRGVHAASLADASRTLKILEDLGRHNAVDKIVGYCFLNGIDRDDKLLLTTGRITSEVMVKAGRSGFPVVISKSSASSMALRMAENAGIDVVTYVRAGRFNYFSHAAAK